ncbi:MAG TPA: hypothetical protein DDY70_04415 [Clostridiales bacterium]|nr:hypothetical protein [Clostridiales bacterium]
MESIVYTSNTGSAAQYAKLLSERIGLPVYSLKDASKVLPRGAEIIYIGWIAASAVKGYAKAAKRYRIRAVCAVGMGRTGTQTEIVWRKAAVPANIPLFTLQGNFDVKKLHGIYRPMMAMMVKITGKSLAAKKDRTPEEDEMLDMMLRGGERVRPEHLSAVLDWYRAQP